jgi:hypothetical protein
MTEHPQQAAMRAVVRMLRHGMVPLGRVYEVRTVTRNRESYTAVAVEFAFRVDVRAP